MSQENEIAALAKHLPDAPMPPHIGVSAIALQMAMSYHGINMVQDGALYQQYKIEGREMVPLSLQMVFDTAKQIEEHLVNGGGRITDLLLNSFMDAVEHEMLEKQGGDSDEPLLSQEEGGAGEEDNSE